VGCGLVADLHRVSQCWVVRLLYGMAQCLFDKFVRLYVRGTLLWGSRFF
jgi:hypothetical protein